MKFLYGILVKVSGLKLESSTDTSFCQVFYPLFSLFTILFINRPKFFFFDSRTFLLGFLKPEKKGMVSLKSVSRRDCESHATKDSSLF
jgi:hypothetical protein